MKIKRIPKTVIFFLFLLFLNACDTLQYKRGNGEMVVKTHYPDDFDEIAINGNYKVFLEKGNEPKVVINVDENLLEYIEVESYQGILYISSTKKIRSKEEIKIFITYRNVKRISNSGVSAIFTESPLVSEKLNLTLSGAGLIEMELDVSTLEIKLSGAGYIKLKGSANNQVVSMSGAGGLDAYELESTDCDISISGVGGAKVYVSGTLIASVSGVGSIMYRGNPVHVNRKVSGIGKIQSINEENL